MNTQAGIQIRRPPHTRAVTLRNGLKAVTWLSLAVVCNGAQTFPILGLDEEGFFHSWRYGGFWSEDKTAHPFDIVS